MTTQNLYVVEYFNATNDNVVIKTKDKKQLIIEPQTKATTSKENYFIAVKYGSFDKFFKLHPVKMRAY